MDPALHKLYLDYRERHTYFGRRIELLTMDQFARAHEELAALEKKGAAREPLDEARKTELEKVLFRD